MAASTAAAPLPQSPPLALQLAVAGAASCAGATATNPLDLVKCRLQYSRDAAPRTGWLGVASAVVRQEGPSGLFRGLAASLLRESTYSALRLGLYGPVRDAIAPPPSTGGNGVPSFVVKIAAGLTSGCFAAAATNPADVVKVRAMVAHAQGRHGVRLASELRALLAEGRVAGAAWGAAGLWRGVVPNVQRAALVTAAQVGTYDEAKGRIARSGLLARAEGARESPLLHFGAAVAAGLASALITTPVDTLKTRVMADGRGGAAVGGVGDGGGTLAALRRVARAEGGVRALFRGFWPTWARLALHTVVTFMAYEQLRAAAGIRPL